MSVDLICIESKMYAKVKGPRNWAINYIVGPLKLSHKIYTHLPHRTLY